MTPAVTEKTIDQAITRHRTRRTDLYRHNYRVT